MIKFYHERLKELVRKRGMNLKMLAEKVNRSDKLFWGVDKGTNMLSRETIELISRALNVRVGYWFAPDDKKDNYLILPSEETELNNKAELYYKILYYKSLENKIKILEKELEVKEKLLSKLKKIKN